MAKDDGDDGGDSGTFKVTEGWLKGEAKARVDKIAAMLTATPDYTVLSGFSATDGKGSGKAILSGSGTLGTDAVLQRLFATLCSSLKTHVDALGNGFNHLSMDMATVDTILQNSEDGAALTAAEMNMELQQALTDFGGSPPPNPAP
ncbi:hypothetical protein [Streptomyces sp. NPDC059398]|uniref:hypothetical protein n=1 Tax=Streptomyces sp. NPDC059398 TaxID=3346820 RepID=UPI00368F06EA